MHYSLQKTIQESLFGLATAVNGIFTLAQFYDKRVHFRRFLLLLRSFNNGTRVKDSHKREIRNRSATFQAVLIFSQPRVKRNNTAHNFRGKDRLSFRS